MITVQFLQVAGLLSLFTFAASLLAVPWLINRMPEDYFLRHWEQLEERKRLHPAVAGMIMLMRNFIGVVLTAVGIAMLVLPGQGILTIVIGICVMDFPGKRYLIKKAIARPRVQKALNWIRRKGKKPLFKFP